MRFRRMGLIRSSGRLFKPRLIGRPGSVPVLAVYDGAPGLARLGMAGRVMARQCTATRVLLFVLLLAACSAPRPEPTPTPSPPERTVGASPSPTPSPRISYASGCGTGGWLDWIESLGRTPESAFQAFVANQRSLPPVPDARRQADKDAVVASGPLAINEGRVEGEWRFVARDEEGILGIFGVGPFPPDGYVVWSYWVRLPEEFCEGAQTGGPPRR